MDTNTLVSGLGWRGTPGMLVDAVLDGRLDLVTSPPLLDELARVLDYPKLAKVFPEPERIVSLIMAVAENVKPTVRFHVVDDEPDNRLLEAATTAEVDIIVTGDRQLRNVGLFHGIDILTAAEALPRVTGTSRP